MIGKTDAQGNFFDEIDKAASNQGKLYGVSALFRIERTQRVRIL